MVRISVARASEEATLHTNTRALVELYHVGTRARAYGVSMYVWWWLGAWYVVRVGARCASWVG